MEGHRRGDNNGPWMGWLLSLFLGAGLALLCMTWLGRRAMPAAAPVSDAAVQSAGQRSLGFELVLRFRFLLPEKGGGGQ